MHPQSPKLRALADKWADVPAGERANYQLYLSDLADALGVARPQPRGSGYEFEYPLPVTDRSTGKEKKNFVDLYRVDHFVLEAKDRGGDGAGETALRKAYAQAKHYTVDLPHAPPPYLLVLDVGRTLLVWDRWSGTYGGFNLARRFDLRTLADRPEEIDFLRAVWESPASLDPRGRAAAVTREVAARLAELSGSLEDRGHDPEIVAKFLMRCVFTMFAEDVELLAGKPFQTALAEYRDDPVEFAAAMEELWAAMDVGRRFGLKKLLRFNGHFFKDASALPLTKADLAVLFEAAKADWKQVEPTIFGTLLTRALDPKERHKLGAEYTPRAYVERVVRQTVEVPIRDIVGACAGRGHPAPRIQQEEGQIHCGEASPRVPRLAQVAALPRPGVRERQLPVRDAARGEADRAGGPARAVEARPPGGDRDPGESGGLGAGRGGGGALAVPRDRDQAVGARDRGVDAVDRLPPVLDGAPPGHQPARARPARYRHARTARCGARVGRDRGGAGEVAP